MSYKDFLDNIDKYVGKIVEFTIKPKANNQVFKSQRVVWDNKEFGPPSKDALIEVLYVEVVG